MVRDGARWARYEFLGVGMKYFTYLLYILLYEGLIIGGCGYAVFVLNFSGWWFLLACMLSSAAYSPGKWIHGYVDGAGKS